MDNANKVRIYEHLASAFLNEKVDTFFALLGDANMYWASRLAERGARMINVRHEHAAIAAAMAWGRRTGRIGVATVTCGPGVTNMLTALPAAVIARVPMVVFAGEAPMKAPWYNQFIEQSPLVTATGAAYITVHAPERLGEVVRDAFIRAAEEKRPVVLGVPMDLQDQWLPGEPTLPEPSFVVRAHKSSLIPHPDDLALALRQIAAAKRIVVLGGLGATAPDAINAARALAARLDGVLATTLPARGLYHEDPYCVGIAGGLATPSAAEVLREADLVIAAGASLAYHTSMGGRSWPKAVTLRIDRDPATISQGRVASQFTMRADATLALQALLQAVPERVPQWRGEALAARLRAPPFAETPASVNGIHDPRSAVVALDSAIPKQWHLINTSGHVSFFSSQMSGRPHDRFLTIREFGAIGNGTSFAVGIAAADPDHPVVLIDGDGSLLMHVQELETMSRSGMKVLVVVLNDGAYGSEIHKLRARSVTDEGAVFGRPDFATIARGLGFEGRRVHNLDELPDLVRAFAERDGCALLDIPISDKVMAPQMAARAAANLQSTIETPGSANPV